MKRTIHPLTIIFLLLPLSFLPALTHAETVVQAWIQRYNGTGNGSDIATAVAADSDNNIIVTGYSDRGGGIYNCVTVKYSILGVPLWTNSYGGPANNGGFGYALKVDGNDDIVVTGYANNGANVDYMTIRYSSAGVGIWTNLYNGPGNGSDQATAVAVDSATNVIVTGYSTASNGYWDYATIKYSSVGVPLWTNRYNGPGNNNDQAYGLAVDGNDAVIVTGYSTGSGSSQDYTTIKYSSTGLPLWTNRYNGPGNGADKALAVAVDLNTNVIVTGYSTGSSSGDDYTTIKYSSAGAPLWTNSYNGPANGNDLASALAVDSNNNVLVTGYSSSSGTGDDYLTIKYSDAGVPLWTNRYNGQTNGRDHPRAIGLDSRDNVIVTGWSDSIGMSNPDYLTIKYSSDGVPLWTNRYNGPAHGDDETYAVAVDHQDGVIVAGFSPGSGSGNDYATIKYTTVVPPPAVAGVLLTDGTFQLEVDNVSEQDTVVIEACTDLLSWLPIFTNTAPTNVVVYTDLDATNYSGRFYRAYQFP